MLEGAFWQPLTHVAAGQVGTWPVSTGDGQYTYATEATSQGRGLVYAHVALSARCRPDRSSAAQFCRVTLQQCTQHTAAILATSYCVSRAFTMSPACLLQMALLVLVTVTVVPFMQYQVSVMQLPDAFLAVLAVRQNDPTAYLQPLVDGVFRCSPTGAPLHVAAAWAGSASGAAQGGCGQQQELCCTDGLADAAC